MEGKTVQNPRPLSDCWYGKEIGDPFLMRFNGTYYLYASGARMPENPGIKCWTSVDLVDFSYAGYVATDPRIDCAYAPEVCYNAGKFYMVTSPYGSGHYLLRADHPLGPFEIISENFGQTIDGSIFIDDDGKSYFYRAGHDGIHVHAMPAPDKIALNNTVLAPTFLQHWTEGPMVIKRDGRYFLTNTGNHTCSRGYHVDYFVSHDGPDKGYFAMKEQQLLLETRDDFHTLGHSSSCLGPDLGSHYICYHKNILDAHNRPDHRSMNIDRLFFNGDRMYTNACWWEQKAPRGADCERRGREGLIPEGEGLVLPNMTEDAYIAEINFTLLGDKAKCFFSRRAGHGARLTVHRQGDWALKISDARGERATTGRFCSAIDPNALMTLRISLQQGVLTLWMNQLEIFRQETALSSGLVGISGDAEIGYMAFTNAKKSALDGQADKMIPGTWDAVHCLETDIQCAEGETGCEGLCAEKGRLYHYPVNVWKQGKYHCQISMRAQRDAVLLKINGTPFIAQATHAADEQGMEKRYVGEVTLEKGQQVLSLEVQDACVTDRIYFLEADDFAPASVIENGQDVTAGALHIIGHKAQRSMLKKATGFTAAEGYGEGYFGGNWRDVQVCAVLHVAPTSPDAKASIYLRSRCESWHQYQVHAGRIAYGVRVEKGKISLVKQCYDEKILATAALELPAVSTLTLLCRVRGSQISVLRETEVGTQLLLCVTDPRALACGRIGLDARGDGIGFVSLSISAPSRD